MIKTPGKLLPMRIVDKLIAADVAITVSTNNPKGGKSAARFEGYSGATCCTRFLELGGTKADLQNGIVKRRVKLVGASIFEEHPIVALGDVKPTLTAKSRTPVTEEDDDDGIVDDEEDEGLNVARQRAAKRPIQAALVTPNVEKRRHGYSFKYRGVRWQSGASFGCSRSRDVSWNV